MTMANVLPVLGYPGGEFEYVGASVFDEEWFEWEEGYDVEGVDYEVDVVDIDVVDKVAEDTCYEQGEVDVDVGNVDEGINASGPISIMPLSWKPFYFYTEYGFYPSTLPCSVWRYEHFPGYWFLGDQTIAVSIPVRPGYTLLRWEGEFRDQDAIPVQVSPNDPFNPITNPYIVEAFTNTTTRNYIISTHYTGVVEVPDFSHTGFVWARFEHLLLELQPRVLNKNPDETLRAMAVVGAYIPGDFVRNVHIRNMRNHEFSTVAPLRLELPHEEIFNFGTGVYTARTLSIESDGVFYNNAVPGGSIPIFPRADLPAGEHTVIVEVFQDVFPGSHENTTPNADTWNGSLANDTWSLASDLWHDYDGIEVTFLVMRPVTEITFPNINIPSTQLSVRYGVMDRWVGSTTQPGATIVQGNLPVISVLYSYQTTPQGNIEATFTPPIYSFFDGPGFSYMDIDICEPQGFEYVSRQLIWLNPNAPDCHLHELVVVFRPVAVVTTPPTTTPTIRPPASSTPVTPIPEPTLTPSPTPTPTPEPTTEPTSEPTPEPPTPTTPQPPQAHHAYIIGFTDGTVRPHLSLSRAQLATILFRLMPDNVRGDYWSQENSFLDVRDSHWFNNAVSTTTNYGIFMGMPGGEFQPHRYITRGELVAAMVRYLGFELDHGDPLYNDIGRHWAGPYINAIALRGWTHGIGSGGNFLPNQAITRAEAAAIINRMLGRLPMNSSYMLDGMTMFTDNIDPRSWYFLYIQEAANSHYYIMNEEGTHEIWTELIIPPRRWYLLERRDSMPGDIR